MAQQGKPFLIPFGKTGMVSHPNRWEAAPSDLALAENVTFENDLVQKDPRSVYYDPTGVDHLRLKFPFTSGVESWLVVVVWVEAAPPTSPPPAGGPNTVLAAAAAPSPWAVAVGAGPVPVGALHAVRYSREAGAGGIISVQDSRGNWYTRLHARAGVALRGEIWGSIITTELQVGDTVTTTFTAAGDDWNIIGTYVTGVAATSTADLLARIANVYDNEGVSNNVTPANTSSHIYPLVGIALVAATNAFVTAYTTPWVWGGTVAEGAGANHQIEAVQTPAYNSPTYIVAQTEWRADQVDPFPAGTASVARGSRNVVGVGTTWDTAVFPEFRPGDTIIIGGESQIVHQVINDLSLTTVDPFDIDHTLQAVSGKSGPRIQTVVAEEDVTQGANTVGVWYEEQPQDLALGLHGDLNNHALMNRNKVRRGRFVVGGKEVTGNFRRLFYFNGYDVPGTMGGEFYGFGGTAGNIAFPAADWGAVADPIKQPINAVVHEFRLVAFGNLNSPHRIYFSSPTNHQDFRLAPTSDAIQMQIASHVGDRLFCGAQMQGMLFLWKYPNGIFYLDDSSIDPYQWGYRTKSLALGCAPSPHAALAVDDDVIFCDPQGHFHLLSAVNTLGGTADSDLTRVFGLQEWTRRNVDVSALKFLCSVYDTQTKTAWFGLRSLAGDIEGANDYPDNDLIIRWDFSQKGRGPIRMSTSRNWRPNTLCLKHRDYIGREGVLVGEVGNSWLVEPGVYGSRVFWDFVNATERTVGIPTQMVCAETDLTTPEASYRHIRKSFHSAEIVLQEPIPAVSAQPITVEFWVDGGASPRDTVVFQQAGVRRIMRTLSAGDGYSIAATLRTDGAVPGDVPLLGVMVYFTVAGTDHSRAS